MTETVYSQGIMVPVQPGRTGGFRLVRGDDYITQLILVLAGDADSENPFQDEGIGLRAVFANLSDPAWRSEVKAQIEVVFDVLHRDNLAKLADVSFLQGVVTGEVVVRISYLSLETNTVLEVETTVRRS